MLSRSARSCCKASPGPSPIGTGIVASGGVPSESQRCCDVRAAGGGSARCEGTPRCCDVGAGELRGRGGSTASTAAPAWPTMLQASPPLLMQWSPERRSALLLAVVVEAAKAERGAASGGCEALTKGGGATKAVSRSCKGRKAVLQRRLAGTANDGWRCCKGLRPELQRPPAGAASDGRQCCKGHRPELQTTERGAAKAAGRSCKRRKAVLLTGASIEGRRCYNGCPPELQKPVAAAAKRGHA